MATDERYFVSGVDLDWHKAGNWSATDGGAGGVGVPTGDSNVYLTNVSSNNNCNLSANAACLSLTIGKVGNLYTGTFDAVTFDIAIGTGGFDGEYGGSATVLCGIGSEWTCSGDFNNKNIGTWTKETSTVVLTGTTKILTGNAANAFNDLTFLNGSSITVSSDTTTRVACTGTLTIDGELTLDGVLAVNGDGDMVIGANAVIGGTAYLYMFVSNAGHGLTSVHANATINCEVRFYVAVAGTKCVPFTTSGVFRLLSTSGNNTYLQLDNLGDYVFGSILFFNSGTGLITLDNAANDPASITCGDLTCQMNGTGHVLVDGTLATTNWTITGDVIQILGSTGRLTWIAGSGDMTFSGNDSVDIDFGSQTVESVTIDKAGTGIIDLQSGDFELGANSSMYGLAISGDTDLDALTSDVALGAGGLNCTNGSGATISLGTDTTWTITGGTFNYEDIGNFNRDTSTVDFVGTCNWIGSTGFTVALYNAIVTGTTTIPVSAGLGTWVRDGELTVNGTLLVAVGEKAATNHNLVTGANSRIGGAGTLNIITDGGVEGFVTRGVGTTIDIAFVVLTVPAATPLFAEGVYDSAVKVNNTTATNGTMAFVGSYSFGSLEIENTNAGGTLTIDNSVNDPTFEITGDVIWTETAPGELVWTPGTGEMLFSGNLDVDIDFGSQTVESITIDKAGTGIIDLQSGDFELGANSSMYGLEVSGNTDLDALTFDVALGAGGLDCSSGSGATISMGTDTTWTITGGTFDYEDIGNFNDDTSTIVFVGTCSWIPKSAAEVRTVNIASGTTTMIGGTVVIAVLLAVEDAATLLINGGQIYVANAEVTTGIDSRIGGTALLNFVGVGTGKGYTSRGAGTTIDVATFILRPLTTSPGLPAGTYSSAVRIYNSVASAGLLTLSAGSYAFDSFELESSNDAGTVTLEVGAATDITVGGTLLIDLNNAADITVVGTNASGDCNWILQGDVAQAGGGGGSFIWTPGTGGILLNDTNAQAVDFAGETVEAIIVDKASETVTLGDDVTTASFTGESGTLDPNGKTLTTTGDMAWQSGFIIADPVGTTFVVGGNFTANGQDLSGASGAWNLDVTGSAVAVGPGDVANSTAGVERIDARWTDSGGNSGWDFTVPIDVSGFTGFTGFTGLAALSTSN